MADELEETELLVNGEGREENNCHIHIHLHTSVYLLCIHLRAWSCGQYDEMMHECLHYYSEPKGRDNTAYEYIHSFIIAYCTM